MILFAETLIEVRHIESGRLLQVSPVPVILTWENQGGGGGGRVDAGSAVKDNRDYKIHVALARGQDENAAGPGHWASTGEHTLFRLKASDGC
jgi:hypothetical protein